MSLVPSTYNYIVLNNVIKVISNFTVPTNISGTSIFNGTTCTTPCYLTYTSMTPAITLSTTNTTPSNIYNVHLEGLLTTVVLNPLFSLQQQTGINMTGSITTNGSTSSTGLAITTTVRPAIVL
jgi:hypothetical protein